MTQTPDQEPALDPAARPDTAPGSTGGGTGPTTEPTPSRPRKEDNPLRASRTSGFYTATIALGVVLVLLIIFIVQNTDRSSVKFLVWEGSAPLAVLLLIATAAGIFLTALASSLRLLQVRRRVKRARKAERA